MAAVLCNACGDICNGACEVCGHVCSKPCQACGQVCNGFCDGCEACCSSFGNLCSSPFSIYVTVATIFNLPSVYFGLMEVADMECRGSQWLFVNAILCLVNVIAAFYMAVAVTREESTSSEQQVVAGRQPTSAFARAGYMFCYDPWIAVYILVLTGFFCWLWTGGIWSLNGKAANGCNGDTSGAKIATALGFGWAFFFFGIGALMIGMCCAYCYKDTTTSSTTTSYYETTGTSSAAAATTTTPYVNADSAAGKTASNKTDGKIPTVAATPAPFAASTTKQDVPTVTATLF
ncbi:expressed unknown protein [Seminavis robusta]|uniref:Uncharacterized protein n=1 Tax=Seminavis robusta TaxID=568900 RepID=A0A9N8DQ25_9STRA|nr:expressed unknown protein [Seminavis robusta]|eukprot:Sro258_g101090.1 n/a (290) ;mRNA; f:31710-32579